MSKDSQIPPDDRHEARFRRITGWLVFLGTGLFSFVFLLFVVYHSWIDDWTTPIVKAHYAATVGLPLAAIASICVVLMLKFATGPIEFEAIGFKFRGAAGPLIFWIMCFLAMAIAIKLLWPAV